MESILTYEDFVSINEKLITFGGKPYPNFNQVVIIAGGGGSGKGFQLSNLVGIEGKVMNVDDFKTLVLKSKKVVKNIKDETGYDISKFELGKNPDDVGRLHDILKNVYPLVDANKRNVFKSILLADKNRKPNLIFDVTLKEIKKFFSIVRTSKDIGYKTENIHLVWVIDTVGAALKKNRRPDRGRIVPEDILIQTHEGASLTMRRIMEKGSDLQKYMDGDIWFSFNKINVDTDLEKSEFGGSYIKDADYVQLKKKGQQQLGVDDMNQKLLNKIRKYTPKIDKWAK